MKTNKNNPFDDIRKKRESEEERIAGKVAPPDPAKATLEQKREALARQYSPMVKKILEDLKKSLGEGLADVSSYSDCTWLLHNNYDYGNISNSESIMGVALKVDKEGNPKYFECQRYDKTFRNRRRSGLSAEELVAAVNHLYADDGKGLTRIQKLVFSSIAVGVFGGAVLSLVTVFILSLVNALVTLVFNKVPSFLVLSKPFVCDGVMTVSRLPEVHAYCDGKVLGDWTITFILSLYVFPIIALAVFIWYFRLEKDTARSIARTQVKYRHEKEAQEEDVSNDEDTAESDEADEDEVDTDETGDSAAGAAMNFAAMELKTKCPQCGNPMILNGPVLKSLCVSCQTELDLPAMSWKSMLEDIPADIRKMKDGEGRQSTQFSSLSVELKYFKEKPLCPSCKMTLIFQPADVGAEQKIPCPKCRHESVACPAPQWLRIVLPEIAILVNARQEAPDGVPEAPAGKPVHFSCPSCSGNLKVDGSSRTITCRYCSSDIYLPDDLWLRLHPVRKVGRWYLGLTEDGRALKPLILNRDLLAAAYDADDDAGAKALKKGADPNAADADGRSALFLAAATDAKELVRVLIHGGAEVDKADNAGTTPLGIAAYNGFLEVVNTLLEQKVDINHRNKVGVTAIYGAAKMGHKKIVELLMARGADHKIPNEEGVTPREKALEMGHKEIAEILAKAGG